VRAGAARRRGAAVRRLDHAPTVHRGLEGALPGLPLPAVQRQLHRGRHVGDPGEHHRRAGPRAAGRTPGGHRPRMEGPAAMTSLRYSEVEEELRAAVRGLLRDRAPWPAVLARTEGGEPVDRPLWRTLAADMGVAGL